MHRARVVAAPAGPSASSRRRAIEELWGTVVPSYETRPAIWWSFTLGFRVSSSLCRDGGPRTIAVARGGRGSHLLLLLGRLLRKLVGLVLQAELGDVTFDTGALVDVVGWAGPQDALRLKHYRATHHR